MVFGGVWWLVVLGCERWFVCMFLEWFGVWLVCVWLFFVIIVYVSSVFFFKRGISCIDYGGLEMVLKSWCEVFCW